MNLGDGRYPKTDHLGREFSKEYMPERAQMAGSPICGPFRCVLDGVMADWEFHKLVFKLDSSLIP